MVPQGLALYLRHIKRKAVKAKVKRISDNGLRWVAIGGPWHDQHGNRWINRPDNVLRMTEMFANAGVEVHIWGYPWHDRIEKFVDEMQQCTCELTTGWLLDPELGLKRRPKEAAQLFTLCRKNEPYLCLGMTSYGLPYGHKSFPFDAFAEQGISGDPTVECDYGSPQLYDTPPDRILKGMNAYSQLGFDEVVPSFGNYKFIKRNPSLPLKGSNRKAIPLSANELHNHLSYFVDSPVEIDAMIGWAENFTTPNQWRILARWSDWLVRGATSLK